MAWCLVKHRENFTFTFYNNNNNNNNNNNGLVVSVDYIFNAVQDKQVAVSEEKLSGSRR
jgi:hypothetical protein